MRVYTLSQINKHQNQKIRRYNLIMVASGILIINDKVLIIKRGPKNFPDTKTWALPCGRVKNKELPSKAVVREFEEETNIKTSAKRLISVESYFYDKNRIRTLIMEFIYEVKAIRSNFQIRLDNQHIEYRFVELKNLTHYPSLVKPRHQAVKRVFDIYG